MYYTSPLPDSLRCLHSTEHIGSAARGSPILSSTSTIEVCGRGNPDTHGTSLDTAGLRAIHRKRAPRVHMHTRYESIHPRGEVTACAIWIQHPLVRGGRGEVVWGKSEAVPYRGGLPVALSVIPHNQPVGTTQRGYAKCQQHHGQVVRPGVTVVWVHLPSHSSGDLGVRPRQGLRPGVKYGRDRCLSLRHALDVPGGSLCLRHPIGI